MSQSIVRDLLHVATGFPHSHEGSISVSRVIEEAVLSEMNFLLTTFPKAKKKQDEVLSEEILCRILAFLSPNRSCLSRLVQKLIAYDDVMQHKDSQSSCTKVLDAKTAPRKATVIKALEYLEVSAEEMHEVLGTSNIISDVKHARLVRGNIATEAMNQKEYLSYAEARRSSFPPMKPKISRSAVAKKGSGVKGKRKSCWFDKLDISLESLTSLAQLTLSILANELVILIVDLVHILRTDLKKDKNLRYKLLRAAERHDVFEIQHELLTILSLPLQSPITVDEVRNVYRMFSSVMCNRLNGAESTRRSLFLYF